MKNALAVFHRGPGFTVAEEPLGIGRSSYFSRFFGGVLPQIVNQIGRFAPL
jgi:hypothetical protein